jgi:hypothetical protein
MVTHKELVKLAARWLKGHPERCGVIIAEIMTSAGEIPDVIGWHIGNSVVIECKTSRSDFLRDKDKCHHRADRAMGKYRYFLAPKGTISVHELDENTGLLEIAEGVFDSKPRITVTKKAIMRVRTEQQIQGEFLVLTSALRRIQTREFITIIEDSSVLA